MDEQRYFKLKEEPNLVLIKLNDLTENFIPVYIQALHIPSLNIITNEFEPPKDAFKVEKIILSGYARAYKDYIYVEYLNPDGFLKTNVYAKYFDFPTLFLRKVI